MNEESEFNLPEGEGRREEGMALARHNRARTLHVARMIARYLGRKQHLVSADDVQRLMIQYGQGPLGNAAGSLFRGDEWEFTGEWTKSSRVSNHAHQNRIWRYTERREGNDC